VLPLLEGRVGSEQEARSRRIATASTGRFGKSSMLQQWYRPRRKEKKRDALSCTWLYLIIRHQDISRSASEEETSAGLEDQNQKILDEHSNPCVLLIPFSSSLSSLPGYTHLIEPSLLA